MIPSWGTGAAQDVQGKHNVRSALNPSFVAESRVGNREMVINFIKCQYWEKNEMQLPCIICKLLDFQLSGIIHLNFSFLVYFLRTTRADLEDKRSADHSFEKRCSSAAFLKLF